MPPSIHVKTGEEYVWNHHHFSENGFDEVRPVPKILLNKILAKINSHSESTNYRGNNLKSDLDPDHILNGIPEGKRNDTLFRYACKLISQGFPLDAVVALINIAASRAIPPLPEIEVKSIIKSASKYSSGDSSSLADSSQIEVKSLREILTTEFPEPKWVVEGLMSEGLNLLVGVSGIKKYQSNRSKHR
jgi:hypothetical protein